MLRVVLSIDFVIGSAFLMKVDASFIKDRVIYSERHESTFKDNTLA
jgi:hypothetical protein